jgi:WD40 repeat protein
VLTAGPDRAARILTAGGKVLHVLRHPSPVSSATFSPDGKLVFTADDRRTLRVWRTGSGALVRAVAHISSGPLALSPDGRLLAAPAPSGAVTVWRTTTFQPAERLKRGGQSTAVAFSSDGRLIATADGRTGPRTVAGLPGRYPPAQLLDNVARVWESPGGTFLRTFTGHTDSITSVQFSPNGKLLLTSSRDHDARIWDVESGRPTVLLRGHFSAVFGASFSPDQRWVVTAGPLTAGLWQASNGRQLSLLRGHTDSLTSASFSHDGRRILTSSRDGTVRTYKCELCAGIDELLTLANARLAALSRFLTPAERTRYISAGSSSSR